MRALQEIDQEIARVSKELDQVQGLETEIYTRIVGYYRSLRNWNKGKKEEYNHRLVFKVPEDPETRRGGHEGPPAADETPAAEAPVEVPGPALRPDSYAYFYRKACPNCGPVARAIEGLPLRGTHVDVDQAEGLAEARLSGVSSTPTVIFYDKEGRPVFQGRDLRTIREFLAPLHELAV